ncbi:MULTISPECIES: sulfurtransferase TusA family protein [Ignatzschineria]|uniref:Sulfurtransferase TusA family protein n=1 Tax=Ignatzschineria cameli TaxID=2182793 RepID=A0ABX5L0Z5_9GAMM|nr:MULTISPECIES: sulfurtransferase TusA family protein [Ignatzschineria]MDM1544650.1 sulfurtransferase TusA family protein [Ignatzschineria indica]PWD90486.1 sulfurtransferase TusA family protein [Ignatzschineria cameli]PWD92370.1 sulfurtransferase TusA family protein [Ignatzschineria cameli]PWD93163.1 sulfurtransferase TusA family protein [Ignatzschineria cameli]
MSECHEKAVIQLDLKGLNCPMPILKTKQALMRAEKGDRLEVYATDPHAEIDFKAYLARTEHQLLSFEKRDDLFIFLIEKA